MTALSRRDFLRSAGGVTFLAMVPDGRGLFAAPGTALPKFTALPYVQPGPASMLINGAETRVIAWQTELSPAQFTLEYGATKAYGKTAPVSRAERWQGETDKRYNYAAALGGLTLSKTYYYKLTGGGKTLAEGYFATRKKRGESTRFVAFGDNSYSDPGQRAIAYHAYRAHPDLIVNTGDNVYEGGLDSEYAEYFFPVYNADTPDPKVGAPLLRSVPFYTVIANHDVHHKDAEDHPAADFDQNKDALAYYTAMHLPLNGPATPPSPTPTLGASALIADFQKAAGARFPQMANYSFDYGDVHFLCLDSNDYIDPTSPALQAWIASDLSATDANWKFVVYHHPAFNAGAKHYKEQHMRALSPLFEAHGVDFCLHGHEHIYQRTLPLKFAPSDLTKAPPRIHVSDRRIPGMFTLDTKFDGKTVTKPNGIIYITTGAGGKELYDPGFDDKPELWRHADDKNVAYVSRFVSSLHSFTVFDVHDSTMTLTQIGEDGKEFDHITVTKA